MRLRADLVRFTNSGFGTTATNNDLFMVKYEYGELQTNGTVDATKNIGNIARTTDNHPDYKLCPDI